MERATALQVLDSAQQFAHALIVRLREDTL